MLVLNFSHPLTSSQVAQIGALAGGTPIEISTIPVQIDQTRPLEEQVAALVDACGLSAEEWQTLPVLINPPGYAPAAFVLVAEIHGRSGQFPTLVRLRPVPGSVPTSYEVSELINLQDVRMAARTRRLS